MGGSSYYITGNIAYLNGYLHQSMTLGIGSGYGKNTAIGIGMARYHNGI